ncbi:MAG TPA: tRNA (adenosine(37)-N6)-dimethylallyltransferase MiaA [Anaerolineales bacterium]|nr:tRNA (adenosine(37)-N6)-dimethylallyltransferase MiaA [Anaerolineales bacterium]
MMSANTLLSSIDPPLLRPLVVILGPTAVGKTGIAIQVAESLSAEIISADSRLLYTGMDVGTAKPTLTERSRIRHHLIDVTPPDQIWSLAQYQTAAYQTIDAIHQRKRLPILVGGTGQYIHAITQGWKIPPANPDTALRKALESWAELIGYQGLHDRLAHLDPQAAQAIDPPNVRRTIRALEVIFTTGHTFSEQKSRLAPPYKIYQIGIIRPRPELYQRIDERIDEMLAAGFIDEVRGLLDQGYLPNLPALSAIGYSEIVSYIQGECSLDAAITQIKRRIRIFVRRQANWFKPTDSTIHWFQVCQDTPTLIVQTIRAWLNSLPANATNQKQ